MSLIVVCLWPGRRAVVAMRIAILTVRLLVKTIIAFGLVRHTFVVRIADCSNLGRHHKETGREASHGRMNWASHVPKNVSSFGHHVLLGSRGALRHRNPLGSYS